MEDTNQRLCAVSLSLHCSADSRHRAFPGQLYRPRGDVLRLIDGRHGDAFVSSRSSSSTTTTPPIRYCRSLQRLVCTTATTAKALILALSSERKQESPFDPSFVCPSPTHHTSVALLILLHRPALFILPLSLSSSRLSARPAAARTSPSLTGVGPAPNAHPAAHCRQHPPRRSPSIPALALS